MIQLYTENLHMWPRMKSLAKRLLGREVRGPQAVVKSLTAGLDALKIPYAVNSTALSSGDMACVLSGVRALRWAIQKKRAGKIGKLIGGPNIVVTPLEQGRLILRPEIDAYIVPAQWSVDWWSSLVPEFRQKLKVWPAGVEDRGVLRKPGGEVLVFQKNGPEELFRNIVDFLARQGKSVTVLRYGTFRQAEYFSALSRCDYGIYLSQSESQGLALHEAWMGDVPTLVWDRGYAEWGQYRWDTAGLAAPYLSEKSGMFFRDWIEFPGVYAQFVSNLVNFKPREYSLDRFTNEASARQLLTIINNI